MHINNHYFTETCNPHYTCNYITCTCRTLLLQRKGDGLIMNVHDCEAIGLLKSTVKASKDGGGRD